MKHTTVILLMFFSIVGNGQTLDGCQGLESVLKYEPAKKPYYFDKNTTYPITFYDTARVFEGCVLPDFYGRKVEVLHTLPVSTTTIPADYIVIVKKKTSRYLNFIIAYKSSGAYCEFIMKKKGTKFTVVQFKERYL